jgi:hypothetical protein
MKVIFCNPSLSGPTKPYIRSLEKSIPLIKAAGWEEGIVHEIGNPYISAARAIMTRKALDAGADVIIYLDYDLGWRPKDLLTLLETEGDVVAGTYRFKQDEEKYMGAVCTTSGGYSRLRKDGAIYADRVPAGFLKVTRKAIWKFMEAYPDLVFGDKWNPSIDLFNHGAHKGVWYGEDYAFSRNWIDCGGQMFIVPNLDITHYAKDKDGKYIGYKGNFHKFLLRQPGARR